ncbi:MAG: exodeoxyribonuclease VII small subunit [Nitrospiraceae bacterium]|nr:MAG: exodeoxyribonuclease VII small subunit [Nitrospiraceae bacterium]
MATVKFEEALVRLETIVAELERGELPLDDSMRIFEEGIKLSKVCLKMLDDAERRVEILVKDKDGRKRTRPLELEEQSETGQDNGDVED